MYRIGLYQYSWTFRYRALSGDMELFPYASLLEQSLSIKGTLDRIQMDPDAFSRKLSMDDFRATSMLFSNGYDAIHNHLTDGIRTVMRSAAQRWDVSSLFPSGSLLHPLPYGGRLYADIPGYLSDTPSTLAHQSDSVGS